MEISAALAADLSTLTETLDDTDLPQSLQQLVNDAKRAVGTYLGLTITATTDGRQVNLVALEESAEADDILASLRVLLCAADTDHADAIAGPSTELILYAGKRGALTDLAADLSWLTGRDLGDFVLDAHLIVPDNSGELRRMSWINQAIGVLIGRGDTPEHAAREVGMLATRTDEDRRVSAEHLRIGLGDPDTQSV